MKLNEVTTVNSLKDSEYIVVTMENGSVGKIKKSELMLVANYLNRGLMSPIDYATLHGMFLSDGVTGGLNTKWLKCATIRPNYYNMAILDIVLGIWNQNKVYMKVSFNHGPTETLNITKLIFPSGYRSIVGYTKESGENLSIYVKVYSTQAIAVNCLLQREDYQIQSGFEWYDSEPENIIYI